MLSDFPRPTLPALPLPAFIRSYRSRTRDGFFEVDYDRLWAKPWGEVMRDLVAREGRLHTFWKAAHFRKGQSVWAQGWTPNALTDLGEQAMLDVYYRNTGAPAGNFYLLLGNAPASGSIADGDTIGSITEVSGTSYARSVVNRDTTGAGWSRTGSTATSATKTFTAGGTWTTADWLGLADALTAGVLIAHVALSQARTLANTDQLQTSMAISQD